MIQYRALLEAELSPSLFDAFVRRQVVSQCWRKRGGVWRIEYDPFVDDWNKADYRALLSSLKRTLAGQGIRDLDECIDTVGAQLLGVVPYSEAVLRAGATASALPKEEKAARVFAAMAARLCGVHAPLIVR